MNRHGSIFGPVDAAIESAVYFLNSSGIYRYVSGKPLLVSRQWKKPDTHISEEKVNKILNDLWNECD
jgi:hypothetical protein